MEHMRNKQRNRTGTGTGGTNKRKRNNKKSIETSKQEGQMLRYVLETNKQESIGTNNESKEQSDGTVDSEEHRKLTFKDIPAVRKASVKESIRKYEDDINSKQYCIMSEGWCQQHNVRLVRQINQEKQV